MIRHRFRKAPFSKCFPPHHNENRNEKAAFSDSSGLKSVFENLRFRDGSAWTVEFKLRFQISPTYRGTQRIVSVNYLFGRPLVPSDFLERIVTSNSRDMTNLMSVVFGLLKMSFWVP